MPSDEAVEQMADACSDHYKALLAGGCEPSIALDRVFDCFDLAATASEAHCFDERDRLLETKLRNLVERDMEMQKRNWQRPTQVGDADFKRLAPGPYVAKVIAAEDFEEKEYFHLVYDIAEGPDAGFYSDAWGVEHPLAHRIVMSYKDTAMNMLEGRLNAIDASNQGFDSRSALDANRFDMFVGRLVGINLQEEEYRKNDGTIGTRLNVAQVVSAQDVRDGNIKVKDKKLLQETKPTQPSYQQQPSSGYNPAYSQQVEIPFS